MTDLALTVLEAAAQLHCGRSRVFELIASGELKTARSAGRRTLVTSESVERYLLGGRRAPRARPLGRCARPEDQRALIRAALEAP